MLVTTYSAFPRQMASLRKFLTAVLTASEASLTKNAISVNHLHFFMSRISVIFYHFLIYNK